jgi:hypothetical protein
MNGYCKNCHQTHAAWTRLTNGVVCGLCGARERDLRVIPVNVRAERQGTVRVRNQRHG